MQDTEQKLKLSKGNWAAVMNILQVSGYDLLGMQANGYMLHEHFIEYGHDAHMAVFSKSSTDNNIHDLSTFCWRKANSLMLIIQEKLSMQCILPILSLKLYFMSAYQRADIVNLQLVHNSEFFSLLNLPILSRMKTVILSIHDMFMMSGHCIYSMDCNRWKTGCGNCPDLKLPFLIKEDTSERTWKLKNWIFRNSKINLVAGSPWQYERIKQSPILSHLPLHYIPYGVNTKKYRVLNKALCRSQLGIPENADVISFRSVPFSRNFKGTSYIEEALSQYEPKKETYLLTFESVGGLERLRHKYKFIELGWVYDMDLISSGLNAADIFLMPSIAEAFGLMAVESMACGTPVIVFDGTALTETINAPSCGISVPYGDSKALALAIKSLMEDETYRLKLRKNGLKHVSEKHGFEAYANSYLTLYEKLLYERKV
jgi:glycosyltransferase involved in cell wall biosynthesis